MIIQICCFFVGFWEIWINVLKQLFWSEFYCILSVIRKIFLEVFRQRWCWKRISEFFSYGGRDKEERIVGGSGGVVIIVGVVGFFQVGVALLRGVIIRVYFQSCSFNIRIKRFICLEIFGIIFSVSYFRNVGIGVGGLNFKSKMKVLLWLIYFFV